MVEGAAWELEPTEAMIAAAERLYGPYRWGRYDILVLPPSFPFGGMENPRLTFATPTILAGDRSLVSLVAHELAHSWSGNLVTNATWNDFWLNEGFTTYFEHRIMEELYGRDKAESLALLSRQEVEQEIERLGAQNPDTHLALSLAGRDPDEGMTPVAYDKGYLFLRLIEESVGRERWDAFLARYFDRFAFQSMTTERFLEWLEQDLLAKSPGTTLESLRADAWINGPGLPANAPQPRSDAFARVDAELARWRAGAPASALAITRLGHAGPAPLPQAAAARSQRRAPRRARLGVRLHVERQQRGSVRLALVRNRARLRAGVPGARVLPDPSGPSQVPQAALRGAGEDRGRTPARARDLPARAAGLPRRLGQDRRHHPRLDARADRLTSQITAATMVRLS